MAFVEPGAPRESRFAWLSFGFVGVAWAQAGGVQVCLAGSVVCTTTDANGSFVLPVEGDLPAPVCLEITGSSFAASICLPFAVPNGSVVNIGNIECDLQSGTCQAEDVDIEEPGEDVSAEVSDEDVPSEPSVDDVSTADDDGESGDVEDDGDDVSSDDGESGDVEDDVSETS